MRLRILKSLLRKEFTMMRRNPIIPKVIFVMPVMVMLVIPLVAIMDVRNVNVTVVDNAHTQLSRRIIQDLGVGEALTVQSIVGSYDEALRAVENGESDVILTIPADYTGREKVDVKANGVNAMKGMLGANYVGQSVMETVKQWSREQGAVAVPSDLKVLYRYNPTLNFRNYMIPALMVVLLIIICGFLPALNLVSEKEDGTIEAMNVTPVTGTEFVLSKLIPFWLVGILVVTVGMIVGWAVYGLTPTGNIGLIYLATILFSLTMSGLGVLIANRSSTMLQSIYVMFAVIIIFQLMSGLFTPIASMPEWAQIITLGIPPRYFIEIMRSVYLKGASFGELSAQFATLGGLAALLCCMAAWSYKKRS